MNQDNLFTTAEVAKRLKCGIPTVRMYIKKENKMADKIIPFKQRITEPQVHVLAKKVVGALYQLQETWGLKVTDWYFDDSGSEIELEDPETKKKIWIQIGR